MDHRNKGKPPGISTPDKAIELAHKSQEAVAELAGRVAALEIIVNDKSQWNQLARSWVGKNVVVNLLTDKIVTGKLVTLDRYTIVVHGGYVDIARDSSNIIIHKGAIATIEQYG